MQDLCERLAGAAGAVLVTEDALTKSSLDNLSHVLSNQPPWSDIPVFIVASSEQWSEAARQRFLELTHIAKTVLLERPLHTVTLVTAIQAALRGRRRQYELRDHLIERRRAEEALREADQRKDEFLAMLAHELRNPLTPLRNAAHLIRRGGADRAVVGRSLELIQHEVDQMVRLVDDLLDVSRITSGKVRLRKRIVDLQEVALHALDTARPLIEARKHKLTVSAEPVRIEADPTRMEQVVANLLNNAAKYTGEGGNVWLSVTQEGPEAILKVRDTGIGIPGEMLPKIFDLFTQLNRSLDRSQGGLGVGLTLVRRLVEMHGGSVQASSAGPDQGSEFVVRLPALPPLVPQVTGRQDSVKDGIPAVTRRVLIVDDNEMVAESLAMIVRLNGHVVREAHDGEEALEAVREFHPDVVLLDIGLPGMNGYEVARRIRRELDQRLTLVALTGYGREEDRRRSREAGFDHHLTKPIDPDALESFLCEFSPK
jgi:signal transduction histidine kinase